MLHQIGVGALGPVFRTYEPTRDRLVAVKAFRLDITPELAQSLADELSKAAEAGLFHPSIVEPIAAGVEGTVAYRADEYVAAETLDVAMRHYAPAPIEKVLPFITQLAGAIDFARTAGVGHGAMHPRDIFVTPEEARASGFGVVEALERVGLRAPVRRPYTAPERVAGGAWGAPADVFSLAVIAYELLTSRRPSGTGSQIGAIGGQHAAGIHAVLVQAMDDDPSRRPQSALSFASALDRASRGETTAPVAAAAPVPAVAPLPRVDDAVAPAPPAGVDRGEALAFDDIAEERDEDEAHVALTLDELHAGEGPGDAADPSFFDDEAVEDLALEPADGDDPARFSDDFAPAPNPPAGPPAPPPPLFGSVAPATSYGDEPVVVYERGGLLTAPVIVTVALALLVGFAGGYAVGSRAGATGPGDTVAGTTQETGTTPAQPQTAKPYSEQA
ncbi:MAG TPA: protein kinase, partial [Vicinamibacterales bacterium]|nr:protein kinase [Vicinamibacterales bacterium]